MTEDEEYGGLLICHYHAGYCKIWHHGAHVGLPLFPRVPSPGYGDAT